LAIGQGHRRSPVYRQNPGPNLPVPRAEELEMTILKNEAGQGLTEYLVLLILISVASITIVTQMGGVIENRFKAAKQKIQSMSVNSDGG